MTDQRPVLGAVRRQAAPLPDQRFVDELEARLMDGPVAHAARPSRRRMLMPAAAAVVIAAALGGVVMGSQRGSDIDRVRTQPSMSITTSTSIMTSTSIGPTTSTTVVVTVVPPGPTTSTSQRRRSTSIGPTTSTTTGGSSPRQQSVEMSCGLNDAHVVVCEWAEPPVAVAEWHVVRRHTGENEVGIPSTQERRITDPTAEPDTTYTYVVNGYDSAGRSVVLGSASVTTPASSATSAP